MTEETSPESTPPGAQAPVAELPPGTVYDLFQEALPGVQMTAAQTGLDVAITVRREDLLQVMQTARDDQRLAFEFLRSLSGVDYLDELEIVYHLYSYRHDHSAAIKSRCPPDDAHMPTVSHIWRTADWHEREAAEMFGFVFDGHPDLRPLLTEEGLGYYPLRKMHPLAEIEEWQEDLLKTAEEAVAQAAAEAGVPMDERARKIEMAQKKAVVIKKAREEARAKGLSGDDEKAAVQAAIKAFEEEAAGAAGAGAAPAAAPPKPADDRAAKIVLAQKKAALIKKTREEARARGASPEEERLAVAEALKALSAEEKGG
jgi:NADH-quinone oxidoreductase subunit C